MIHPFCPAYGWAAPPDDEQILPLIAAISWPNASASLGQLSAV
jgi:hypothetical protein